MNRTQILERIAQLEKEINAKVDASRVPRTNLKNKAFPMGSWIAAIVLGAVWVFGGRVNADLHRQFAIYVLGIAALIAVFALFKTVMWLLFGGVKRDKGYAKAMEEVGQMQKEKEALQKQLSQAK